ncbi:MAG: IS1595 family transposase [Deltaproteobacteria bacterium]|nr:IS1595 family transposase [Deltaproteobacteria bacterium]
MAQSYEMNLVSLVEQFNSEDKCREYLEQLRWPDGVTCPRCNEETTVSRIRERNQYECDACRYQFSVTSGTIMHDTHLPLWKWFLAVYMMVESKKGVSANQLKRTLKVAYKTAWFLCHRIRKALETPDGLLSGIIEIDETWIGGKRKDVGHGYKGNKALVIGAAQRGGNVQIKKGKTRSRKDLHKFVGDNVSGEAEAIYTDDWPAYGNLGDGNTKHETVNHSADEWVRGDVHTNTIEGAWALFKRSLVGSYHKVSKKHLAAYLDEFEFRYNNRKNRYIFRDAMREIVGAGNMEYRELTA